MCICTVFRPFTLKSIGYTTYAQSTVYTGKLSREKTFANFAVLWLFTKVCSAKFGSVASFSAAQASNLQ